MGKFSYFCSPSIMCAGMHKRSRARFLRNKYITMRYKLEIQSTVKRIAMCWAVVMLAVSANAQTWHRRHSVFEMGDDYHFGYISGSVGYSMLQTNIRNVMPQGGCSGAIGIGYEFRNSGFWANVGVQMSFHRSKLAIDEYTVSFRGEDTQNKPVTLNFRVNEIDEMQWNYFDIPLLVGYYVRGFHVGAGLKISYAINPKTYTIGTYNVSGTYPEYQDAHGNPVTMTDMPNRGYTDYKFENDVKNQLNVGASLIGEIGYDLLSSLPSQSRICHVLKLAFYFEYGLNTQLRKWDDPMKSIVPNASSDGKYRVSNVTVNPYVNTFATPARTVPFFTGVKLTYMIGGSRTAHAGYHHGCMCYQ